MGTSVTESYEGCLWTQLKHLPPQLALKLSPIRLHQAPCEIERRRYDMFARWVVGCKPLALCWREQLLNTYQV